MHGQAVELLPEDHNCRAEVGDGRARLELEVLQIARAETENLFPVFDEVEGDCFRLLRAWRGEVAAVAEHVARRGGQAVVLHLQLAAHLFLQQGERARLQGT